MSKNTDDINPVSDGAIAATLSDVLEGGADREDAKRMLAEFCRQYTEHGGVSERMQNYVVQCLQRLLSGKVSSLDAAFGLKRRRGRPTNSWDDDVLLAARVAELKHQGGTGEAAREQVAAELHKSPEQVKEIEARTREDGEAVAEFLRTHIDEPGHEYPSGDSRHESRSSPSAPDEDNERR